MPNLYANNASATLAAGIIATDGTLPLAAGQGALFPTPSGGSSFQVTLVDAGGNIEIAKCTARTGDALTVTRGQEGTTARVFSAGSLVELRLTKAQLDNVPQLDQAQTFTKPQRASNYTANTGALDCSQQNNFKVTPAAGITLTPSNLAADQSGYILLVNGANYTIAKAASVKCSSSLLAIISSTGTYLLSYYSDGTSMYITGSQALS